jgi:hypothetical protein
VRRDGLISSARNQVETYSESNQRLWLRKPNLSDEVFVPGPEEELGQGFMREALERVAVGYPSDVLWGSTPMSTFMSARTSVSVGPLPPPSTRAKDIPTSGPASIPLLSHSAPGTGGTQA